VIAGTDPRPWQLLHDGLIVRAERDVADEISVWIRHGVLRTAVYPDGGTAFRFRLARCTSFVYTPYDEPPIAELAAIAASEPDLAVVEVHGAELHVFGGAGVIVARYATLAIELDTSDRAVTVDELATAKATSYPRD
jgi:hypothetical protein